MTGRRYGDMGRPDGRPPSARGVAREVGIGLFAGEEGSTTIAAAVAILVSLALVMGLANATWVASRSADVQAVADAGALAGMNVVAAYVTAAQALDALVLSLGLIGMLVLAIGLVLSALPFVDTAGPPVVQAAQKVFDARARLARSAAGGLERLEEAVPYLVAANALATVTSNSTGDGSYVGIAVPYPLEGESDFGDLSADDVRETVEQVAQQGDAIDELARQSQSLWESVDDALERGWRADCGDDPSMRERAGALAGLAGELNPFYPAPESWNFGVAVARAQAYYRLRLAQEAPVDDTPLEATRSAARAAFYRYALEQVGLSTYYVSDDGTVVCDLRPLPANTADVRQTGLYTERAWPCTAEAAGPTIHSYEACPGAAGPALDLASVADEEAGLVAVCPVCQFTVADLGRAPAASTSIDNGFEHYWRLVVEAAQDYATARGELAQIDGTARDASDEAADLFREAFERLGAVRVGLVPPGRYGCVCIVADPSTHTSPDDLATLLSTQTVLPARVAVSAAVLARDPAAPGNTTFASFFDGLSGQGGVGFSVLDAVMSAWGDLLVAYGDGFAALGQAMDASFGQLSDWGLGSLAGWLKQGLRGAVDLVGMQPADLSAKKPVLANSADVMNKAGNDWYGAVRAMVVALQGADVGSGPSSLLATLGVFVETLTGGEPIVVAQFTIPGTDIEIPLELDLGWLAQVGDAA